MSCPACSNAAGGLGRPRSVSGLLWQAACRWDRYSLSKLFSRKTVKPKRNHCHCLPERIHLVVSTLVPSSTGGVNRSMTVTLVDGCRLEIASAVERPKTPAPMMMTDAGKVFEDADSDMSVGDDWTRQGFESERLTRTARRQGKKRIKIRSIALFSVKQGWGS